MSYNSLCEQHGAGALLNSVDRVITATFNEVD